jgi:soluble lytic murein transglycosylase-like protein
MKKPILMTAAFAAALTSFVAHAEVPVAPPAQMQAQKAIAIVQESSLNAQGRIGFPAMLDLDALRSGAYHEVVARYAAEYGVPVSLAHAVIEVESNYRANARGSAGEVGLMQIKPATARGMGFKGSVKNLYDPETNIRFGMKYLGMAHRLSGGTTCGTILRYNAGHAAKRMNPVSRAYCGKVMRILAS